MTVAASGPAAGRGERLGLGRPKALAVVGGLTLVARAVDGLVEGGVDVVVVAAPPGDEEAVRSALGHRRATVVTGADDRVGAVAAALAALPADTEVVLVHDAARCLTPAALVEAVVAALRAGADAVVPVLPVADTVKAVDGDRVTATLDRASLRATQTPQGFRRDVLERAHASGRPAATDDAGLVEACGGTVRTVEGSEDAFKVTRPRDLLLAEAVLRDRG